MPSIVLWVSLFSIPWTSAARRVVSMYLFIMSESFLISLLKPLVPPPPLPAAVDSAVVVGSGKPGGDVFSPGGTRPRAGCPV